MSRTRKGTPSARARARAKDAFGRPAVGHRDPGAGGNDTGVGHEGETFEYLFLHNPQPMWVYDLETLAFLEVNEAATAKYGFTREQFLAMRITDLRPEEDVPRLLANLAQPREVLDAAGEWRHRRSDGTLLDVSVTSHTLSFHRRPAALVVAVDITERKRTETALRRSTLRLQTLHGIDLAILAADSPTEVARGVTRHLRALLPAQRVAVLVSDEALATATYLAVNEDEPMGPPEGTRIPLGWLPPSPPLYDFSRQPVRCWEDFGALPEPPELLERLLRLGARSGIDAPLAAEGRRIGGLTAVSTKPAAFSDEDMDIMGEVASQFAVALHQAQLREHLAAERGKLIHLLEDLPSGVVLVDERGVVLFANPFGREHLEALGAAGDGTPIVALGGMALGDLLQPGPGGAAHEIDVALPRRRTFSLKARPVLLAGAGACWVVGIRDVTVEREQAAQLEMQQRLAVVGEVAGGLAHDLNNILQAIMVFPEGVRGRPVDPKVREVLDVVADQAQRGATLIRRILDFSRRSTTERQTVEIVPFVNAIGGLLRRALPETIAVSFAGAPSPRLQISADPTQLEQILLNLALNARDAMPDGGALRLSVEPLTVAPDAAPPLARMPPGEWVHIAAADTGVGIAPEHLDRIFEPFFTTKPKGKGTGLGLAQVYGLVGQNDGHITVASAPNEGTTFHLYFPKVAAEAGPGPAVAVETPAGAGQTILLAEDEPEVREALRTVLEVLGYRVLEAPDGKAALAHIEAGERPDLLLTDSTMPGMSGAELIVSARRLLPQLKVLALTGYSAEGVRAKLRESGADEILSKPANVDQLARTVARVLGTTGP